MRSKIYYIVYILALVLIFFSCSKSKNEIKKSSDLLTIDSITISENPKLIEYRNFINELDSTDLLSAEKATQKFKFIFTGQSVGLADSGYVYFQQLIDTLELKLNDKFQQDTAKYYAFAEGRPLTKKLINYQNLFYSNGFRILTLNQSAYIEQNRSFLINNFSSIVSNEMNYYQAELNTENIEGFAMEDSIIISPLKLVDRAVWYDRFIVSYPNFVFIENCKKFRKAYLSYLFQGMLKTPLYSSNTEKTTLSPYFQIAYEYLIQNYGTSETANLIIPYFTAIKENQIANSKKILKQNIIKGNIFDFH